MTERAFDDKTREAVKKDISNGMKIADVVRKYGVSEYYAKKWTGEVYKPMDLDTYVRRRYKWVVDEARKNIMNQMSNTMTLDESYAMTDKTWDTWDEKIKFCLYEAIKKVVIAN